jgi:uncharacterized protein YndB with AHSA1/START domain
VTETYTTTIALAAAPDRVFDHFIQPELLVRWMGDRARLVARDDGEFSVDINGVLIRGHFVRLDRPSLIEVAWGEAGNAQMPPGSTRLVVRLEASGDGTVLTLEHSGLHPVEAAKHAIGWPHFLGRLVALTRGDDPGEDPWKLSPPGA